MGFFSSLFGLDKIKQQVKEHEERCNNLQLLCGNPYINTMGSVMYIDAQNGKFYFENLTNARYRACFDFSQYIGADIIVNQNVINQHHTSISGAIMGGLLFGSTGAILGGMSGKTTQEKKIESIKIIFRFDDFNYPFIEIVHSVDQHLIIAQKTAMDNINYYNEVIAKIEYLIRHKGE
ncbi:MAG: hypothetical protein MJ170_02740 [Alphaproteobacteria bacterium]|nr:hypothetical protein [Alphaproteobacteria bacterium]